jgi:hypothetical protein
MVSHRVIADGPAPSLRMHQDRPNAPTPGDALHLTQDLHRAPIAVIKLHLIPVVRFSTTTTTTTTTSSVLSVLGEDLALEPRLLSADDELIPEQTIHADQV